MPHQAERTIDDTLAAIKNWALEEHASPSRLEAIFNIGLAAAFLLKDDASNDLHLAQSSEKL